MRGRRFSRTIPTHLRALPGRCSSFPQDSLSPPQIWMRIAGFGCSPTPCGGNADRYERLSFVPFSNFPLTSWAPLSTVCAFVSSSKIPPLLVFYLEVTSLGLVNNDRDNPILQPSTSPSWPGPPRFSVSRDGSHRTSFVKPAHWYTLLETRVWASWEEE